MHKKNQGFTLVEMAMVLVALALLVSAILVGQELIRNARLLTVASDVEQYKNSVTSFLDKYRYLPGDMPNAANFWQEDANCPNTPPNTLPKTQTCNGNGDTFIGASNGVALGGGDNWYETYRFWQHLANSGFINGNFSGAISERNDIGIELGITLPASKMLGNGYTMLHVLPGFSRGVYSANYHHSIIFGAPVRLNNSTYGAALTPVEAFTIDQKIDDGLPGTGFVLTFTPDLEEARQCATNTDEATARYNIRWLATDTNAQNDDNTNNNQTNNNQNTLSDDEDLQPRCALIFITGF